MKCTCGAPLFDNFTTQAKEIMIVYDIRDDIAHYFRQVKTARAMRYWHPEWHRNDTNDNIIRDVVDSPRFKEKSRKLNPDMDPRTIYISANEDGLVIFIFIYNSKRIKNLAESANVRNA